MDEATFRTYARAWRERQKEEERRRRERSRQAEKAAERLARILVQEYGAWEVWLFGSLARAQGFHRHSDIDLAASGLPAREFFRILSRLNALTEFEVDLVDLEACPAWLAEAIRREGKLLAGPAGATSFMPARDSYAAPDRGGANKKPVPRALTIAGSDSGGGAGIQADLKTFTVLGVYGASVLTAVTAQNTQGVVAVQELSPETVAAQFRAVMDDIGADAVKTGMLGTAAVVATVAALIREYRIARLVVDPVMHAKDGRPLLTEEGRHVLVRELLPLATVVTPNLDEAGALLGCAIRNTEDMRDAARRLRDLGPSWVVIKGGHLMGDAVDVAYDGRDWFELRGSRFPHTTHGTGCTFAAALTAGLARGMDVPAALVLAKEFTELAIRHAPTVGRGYRPPNHVVAGRLMRRRARGRPPGNRNRTR